ncbi:MAG: HAD family hydrolase [Bryobacteraceae bacterium]
MIKTILFDLGKTLIPFDFTRGYSGMEALCGVDAAEIRARLGTTDLVERFESGFVEPDEFVRELSAIIGAEVDYAGFCRAWSSIFLPDPLVPEAMLEALHRNYRLLLLSNTNAIHFAMLVETYPLLRHFDDFVLSYKVKAMKPDPAIYREAIALAGCRAEECFYTDDVAAYVEAARSEGMQAAQFQSLEQLECEMRARGIRWT